jgi:hypothetical protein
VKEGAKIPADGRGVKVSEAPNGFFVGATILDQVQPGMTVAREEVFGPVLNVMHMEDLDAAIELANKSPFGNGASIFTRSGKAAREFKHRIQCGMVGINIGVPASMAWFPFNGWNDSFFGDLHMQGKEGVQFFTQSGIASRRNDPASAAAAAESSRHWPCLDGARRCAELLGGDFAAARIKRLSNRLNGGGRHRRRNWPVVWGPYRRAIAPVRRARVRISRIVIAV